MNRYEKYNNSELSWSETIPEHWDLKRIARVFDIRKEKNSPIKTKEILSLSAKYGVSLYSDKKEKGGNKPKEDLTSYNLCYPGDILINCMNIVAGSVGISNYFGAVSPVYYPLVNMNQDENCTRYMEYVFRNYDFQRSLVGLGKGIQMSEAYDGRLYTVRMRISWDMLKTRLLPIPPIKEQEQIANYLDWKINDIDRLIQLEKEKIKALEKLKEINFNKIIDSSQKNKSIKIKFFANLYGRIGWQGLNSSEYGNEGVYLITGTDFYNGTIDFSKCVRVPNFRWEQNDKIQIKNGDLLITKDGTVGKLAIVTNLVKNATLNSGIMKIDFFRNDIVTKEYLFYILKSNIFKSWFIDLNAGFATIIHLYQKDFYNFSFKYPEMREQEIIVSKIKKLESVFNNQIAKVEESIKALELLKQSLISEVVTGKIDVRNIVIPDYEKVTLLDDETEEFDEKEGIEDGD